ncbi:aspartate/glutamate racemase family protein [Paenibacillus sp. MCAF20]
MIKIGMLTPSSNTILEPITYRIIADIPDVSVHFSRFIVREIALSDKANDQFRDEPMLAAAALLADADVDLIVWNGTSASWLGLEKDRKLCAMIEAETGIPATTSALAIIEAFEALGVKKLGLVTPYTADVSGMIRKRYGELGYECLVERMSGISVNKDFAYVPETGIRLMMEEASAVEGVEALAVVCTNFHAASMAAQLEEQFGVAVIDSVSATVWYSFRKLGIGARGVPLAAKWGKLFLCS